MDRIRLFNSNQGPVVVYSEFANERNFQKAETGVRGLKNLACSIYLHEASSCMG
jgi:hypothetical protein